MIALLCGPPGHFFCAKFFSRSIDSPRSDAVTVFDCFSECGFPISRFSINFSVGQDFERK